VAEPVYILLVDDLQENLDALDALLRREGLALLKVRSGPEALELLLKYEIALALIDVQMPGMDGFELAELMRGIERTKIVPIIFLTAGSSDQQRRSRQRPHAHNCGAAKCSTRAPALRKILQIGKFAAGESTAMCAKTRYCFDHRLILRISRRTAIALATAPRPIAPSSQVVSSTVAPASCILGPPHA
jgi:CheY-like chemotaxis protein